MQRTKEEMARILYDADNVDQGGGSITPKQKRLVDLERVDGWAKHWFKAAALVLGAAASVFLGYELFSYLNGVTDAYGKYLTKLVEAKGAVQVSFDWHMLLMGWAIVLALTVVVVATMRVISPVEAKGKETDLPTLAAIKEVLELVKSVKDIT